MKAGTVCGSKVGPAMVGECGECVVALVLLTVKAVVVVAVVVVLVVVAIQRLWISYACSDSYFNDHFARKMRERIVSKRRR